ncbi:MAG: hypothetical protein QW367_01045 [Candidatus Aenigmatarchaeota archaeon]
MLLGINYKTTNENLRRLVNPGLVWKRRIVKTILVFLRKLEKEIK